MRLEVLLLNFAHGLGDILRAAWDIAVGNKRSLYRTSIRIAAPREGVWDVVTRRDLTYQASGIRTLAVPIHGREDAFTTTVFLGEKPLGTLGVEFVEVDPERKLVTRYLPELTDLRITVGGDDKSTLALSDLPRRQTRLSVSREITHTTSRSRITTPVGIRNAARMLKAQAELEAGTSAGVTPWWHHAAWAAAALASFWLMFGGPIAVMIFAIIAIHEGGHALAMVHYGLGVRLVSFIPFFGGVAVPRRLPDSEWVRAIVALMGVGFSLPFIVAACLYADYGHSDAAAEAAMLAAFINGANLLPLPGLDGNVVVQMLLGKIHPGLARTLSVAVFAAFFAYALSVNDPIIWGTLAFSLVVLVQSISFNADRRLAPLTRLGGVSLLASIVVLTASYVAIALWTFGLIARVD